MSENPTTITLHPKTITVSSLDMGWNVLLENGCRHTMACFTELRHFGVTKFLIHDTGREIHVRLRNTVDL